MTERPSAEKKLQELRRYDAPTDPVAYALWREIGALTQELAEAQSFRINFEHAVKLEREEHERELAEERRLRKAAEQDNALVVQQCDGAILQWNRMRNEAERLRGALEQTDELARCIIDNRRADGGPCDGRCEGCSECLARTLRRIAETVLAPQPEVAPAKSPLDVVGNLGMTRGYIDKVERIDAGAPATPKCKICNHPRHTNKCEENAPNAQFSCSCPGECAHGKHPHYCKECSVATPTDTQRRIVLEFFLDTPSTQLLTSYIVAALQDKIERELGPKLYSLRVPSENDAAMTATGPKEK